MESMWKEGFRPYLVRHYTKLNGRTDVTELDTVEARNAAHALKTFGMGPADVFMKYHDSVIQHLSDGSEIRVTRV